MKKEGVTNRDLPDDEVLVDLSVDVVVAVTHQLERDEVAAVQEVGGRH